LLLSNLTLAAPPTSVRPEQLDNWFAYIPPACYVDTQGAQGKVHNPCYICHTKGKAPNYIDDSDLQLEYSFAKPALVNPWSNLWKDRRAALKKIPDQDISDYVQRDNYRVAGNIGIAKKLGSKFPPEWDSNDNGIWDGFLPDVHYNLDVNGFDRDPKGNYTGWKQYQYAPFPGNFSPINGSVGDAFIRLREDFRVDRQGRFNLRLYGLNLAIVESAIKQQTLTVAPFDENDYGVDLDKNGRLNLANTIVFSDQPRAMKLIGKAGELQAHDRIHLEAGLFPESTEFFHSLRYLHVADNGEVTQAARVKEVRYSVKKRWHTPAQLARFAADEINEKAYTPDRPRWVRGNQEFGVSNRLAWQYRGFIEDRDGELRPQTHQELVFCVGCHSGIGATTDSNFSFARKFSDGQASYVLNTIGAASYAGAGHGTPDEREVAQIDDLLAEYTSYIQQNHAVNDFRNIRGEFHLPLDAQRMRSLLWPTAENAVLMNKAYRLLVQEQSYTAGRDAIIAPLVHMHQELEEGTQTGVKIPFVLESH
jgi:hypothetical protein